MNLNAFEKQENFFHGLKTLFAALNVPVNYIDDKSIAPQAILSKTFKEHIEAYQLMDAVFVLGMVDQAAFEGKKSDARAGIATGKKDYDGILIFGVTLKNRANGLLPTRRQLAEITRAFNREFYYTPVVVVFRYAHFISIANAERITYQQAWREGEKAGKVSLLRDIDVTKPHTGHLKILQELTISRTGKGAVHTFADLYTCWQSVFNVSILNKKFYKELSDWYFWALQEVAFPAATSLPTDDERLKAHHAKNLIRLLTRLLFVWFVKEKNLIPEELFDETYLNDHLINGFEPRKKKGFDHTTQGSTYYRAILQNLFFATLNQTVGKRAFRKQGQQMNVTNLMRYQSYFKNPRAFIELVEKTVPFMNGGLFECLDSPDPLLKGKMGGDVIMYEDGFSDRKDNPLCVPDYIFFGVAEHADLSAELGDKKHKEVTVNGLINILNSYKFTVTENTPIEEDVALDPELLGRVFENLLASYNPETKTTARKQTGSFYTPREIVNYMVDESLKAYLKQKLATEAAMLPEDAEKKLELLIGYNEAYFHDENRFDDKQITVIINAIDNCKILDPACGSGAFPMGILHKLVHVLHKLDADNERWKEVQRKKAIRETEKAFKIGNKQERENRLKEISDVFEYNSDDYGRKLFLIENCIYGVDIQPIATQISKLRCFISLIVDQKADKERDNFGIRPLPNLEIKFVAANTLIGIEKPKAQGSLFDNTKVQELEEKLKEVRHSLFNAMTPADKRRLREEDRKLREEIGVLLTKAGWGNETAKQLAGWDPYNQNTSSPFFDAEWMFGITDGFDVVIGNPPYVQIKQIPWEDKGMYQKNFKSAIGRFNLFYFFLEIASNLSKPNALSIFIVPDRLLLNTQCDKLRKWLLEEQTILEIDSFDESVFEYAVVDSIIISYRNVKGKKENIKAKNRITFNNLNLVKTKEIPISYFLNSPSNQFDLAYEAGIADLIEKIQLGSIPLGEIADTKDGIIQSKIADKLFLKEKLDNGSKKLLFGKNINRYIIRFGNNWVNYKPEEMMEIELQRVNGAPGLRLRKREVFERNKILTRQTADEIIAAYDTENYYYSNTLHGTTITNNDYTPLYVLAILNSKLITWYYRTTTAEEGKAFAQIKIELLRKIPIKKISYIEQKSFIMLADYILYLKSHNDPINEYVDNAYIAQLFEDVIDGCVYELYFEDAVKAAEADILRYVPDTFQPISQLEHESAIRPIIHASYQRLRQKDDPIRNRLMKQQIVVNEIRLINQGGKPK